MAVDLIRGLLRKGDRILRKKGLRSLFSQGLRFLRRHAGDRSFRKRLAVPEATLQDQCAQGRPDDPTISLLVPLYNSPDLFLEEMIRSVEGQSYRKWQLCLADGSNDGSVAREAKLREKAASDPRIRYLRLPGNLGISGNTNACLDLAEGTHVALLDHDDLLAPDALFEVAKVLREQQADFVYTDELCFYGSVRNIKSIQFKPDFAPDDLRSFNYIVHLAVFSRALLDRVGRFDPARNGSQDYDLFLRLTEKAGRIVHIPKVLYYWRVHPGSVSSDPSAKPYFLPAAKAALTDHLHRCGMSGEVGYTSETSIYRIRYDLKERPLISVVFLGPYGPATEAAAREIRTHSTYEAFEFLSYRFESGAPGPAKPFASACRVVPLSRDDWETAPEHLVALEAKGAVLVFLAPDLSVETPDWAEEMLMFCQRPDVGAVGACLLSRTGRIRSAGMVLGPKARILHIHRGASRLFPGYMSRLTYPNDVSAVSLACLMVSRNHYRSVDGILRYGREDLAAVDLCLQLKRLAPWTVFTPLAVFQRTRRQARKGRGATGGAASGPEAATLFQRWPELEDYRDPFYNPNLDPGRADFFVRRGGWPG